MAVVSLGNLPLLPQTCEDTWCKQKRPPTAISFRLGSLSLPSFAFGGAGASPPAFLALGLLLQVPSSSSSPKAHPLTNRQLLSWWLCIGSGRRGKHSHQGGVGWGFSTFPCQPSPASIPGCPSCPSARLPVPPRSLAPFHLLSIKGEVFSCAPRCLPCAGHLVSARWTRGWSHP